ncbi:Zn(II)2Cys6 transcription factor [Aspergillus ibericus CBS 121593]|uniref:Zn(2)-C6 fungal-type domain-containing protein n=1 Tax=Aspergillus ibericus CBS 121593 TaxID=1448316 RepID=A0A395H008_9EURO|nr:hypothetical protein BO80DRAFT_494633 [Aspergillus ibericus CBS 121593]RAK99623.1 hypothetical protein BO80DRAFT_494633 [Aspergillus ibericus CBS 121593]
MTKSTGTRLYRACLRCRQRKTKCDLRYTRGNNHEPCSKCASEGYRCILATSRRGGDYSRFRGRRHTLATQPSIGTESSKRKPELDSNPLRYRTLRMQNDSKFDGGVQNPWEALQILAQTAANMGEVDKAPPRQTLPGSAFMQRTSDGQEQAQEHISPPIMASEIIQEGIVDIHHLEPLVQYSHLWATETFLLASVLTIATQNRPDYLSLHMRIKEYVDKLLLRVALGARSVRHVGSVEGLLLLAEWMPHLMRSEDHLQNSHERDNAYDEDCVAWNLIGLAVRQAYLLHLDKQSFPGEVESEPQEIGCRKRLAWIFTYLADRQISIQMGQAFWCRGPSLSTRFSTQDYPSLQSGMTGGIDYASFVQAQVELTTIFGNIHDVLYASKSRTSQLMIMGDYSKYLDDGAKAMDMWKGIWFNIDIPSSLSCLLTLQFEYLQLYVNAFAFQAVIYRACKKAPMTSQEDSDSLFPDSVMGSPDGRHIYSAIEAAKRLLQNLVGGAISGHMVKFLPIRYYLYEIYASVFLFKTHSIGAIHSDEDETCFTLTREFISMLKAAATSPTHLAYRYAKLLERLWFHCNATPQNGVVRHGLIASDQSPSIPPGPDSFLQAPYGDNGSMADPVPNSFSDILQMDLGSSENNRNDDETFFSSLPFFR